MPVSSLFSSYMPPLRPFLCIHPTPSSVWSPIVRPSESYQPSGYWPTNVLFWFPNPASHMQVCTPPPTCAAGGTWLGCGWRGEGDGTTRDGLESVVLSFVARESVSSSTIDFPLDSCGARLSVCPPPPSPFHHTTVLVPLLSLLTEEYFRGHSARPCPAGPGRPVGCFDVPGPRPCPPPPPPYSVVIIAGSRSPLMGQVAVFNGLW